MICIDCLEDKTSDCFSSGHKRCKPCNVIKARNNSRTQDGLISKIYRQQKSSSKKRGHIPPAYTKLELSDWIKSQHNWTTLYDEWVSSGYERSLIPSVDRKDDDKPYYIGNIELTTFGKNEAKQHRKIRDGESEVHIKHCPVVQYTKEGVFMREFISQQEASRQTGAPQATISLCLQGKMKTSGGFRWSRRFTCLD